MRLNNTLALDLVGGQILSPDGSLGTGVLSVANGHILRERQGLSIDASGYLILPGMIDMHGDGFERHVAPRRGAMQDMGAGLAAAEVEIAANGITTAVLAQFYSWEGGLRGPEFADRLFTALLARRGTFVTDIRPQLRFEIHLLDNYAALPDQVERWGVDYVVFNDHMDHRRLDAGKRPSGMTGQALKAGRSPEKHLAMLQALHARRPEIPAALDRLCADLTRQGVRLGSHDDRSVADREIWRGRGVAISEFPETAAAAQSARAAGERIILGAPNAVRGASHKGNASARDLILDGLCDALASDYHYPSIRRAALMFSETGAIPFAKAWEMVSAGPAQVLGLRDRGTLAEGLRADIVLLDAETKEVAATMAGGRFSYVRERFAERLLSAGGQTTSC